MKRSARLALAFTTWLLLVAILATVLFILLWVVAGPHSGMLPQPLQVAFWIAGYAVILIVPLVAAVLVYRRLAASPGAANPQQDSG